jgi:hypothetical protein
MTDPRRDEMTFRMPAVRPGAVAASQPATEIRNSRPPFSIVIPAADGTELVRMTEEHGMLVVTGDESRWGEGAKRFLYGMMQWSGQVGIRWKDEVLKAAGDQ